MPTDYVVLPDVGRISREQLRLLQPTGEASPQRRRLRAVRSSASTGSLVVSNRSRDNLRSRRLDQSARLAESLSVGGSAISAISALRPESSVDFRLLTESSLENREQLMREALRLPAPPGRPVSVQLVTRAEAIPSSTRPLGIRSLIARGSGAVVARQRESRQSEVQLPEVRREAGRAELRQRLEEQERRLQQQLQEQAELQSQLQRHLEQEQQLQRELREQLEREIEDFNHLEELVTSASRGGVGASASAPAVFADAPQHPAPQETPSQVNSDFVEVPGVGPMSRQQLANLEALLNGDDAGTRAENLPDLSALSSTEATEPAESHVRGSNEEESVMPPQETEHRAESSQPPRGDPHVLNRQAATPQRQPPELMPREAPGNVAWRLKEAALEALLVKVVPETECSICCELLPTKEVVALPCETRGCGSYFHAECIRPWLERNPSCPLCRDTLPQLVRPVTPMPQGTGNPLLDLWFLAMAMQRQERENAAISHRQSSGPSLADLQGVVFTASALVDLLSSHLGFVEDRGPGEYDDGSLNLDMALQAMLASNLNGARGDDMPAPMSREVLPPSTGAPVLRPVNSFQEQILRSAAAMELSDPRSPQS